MPQGRGPQGPREPRHRGAGGDGPRLWVVERAGSTVRLAQVSSRPQPQLLVKALGCRRSLLKGLVRVSPSAAAPSSSRSFAWSWCWREPSIDGSPLLSLLLGTVPNFPHFLENAFKLTVLCQLLEVPQGHIPHPSAAPRGLMAPCRERRSPEAPPG